MAVLVDAFWKLAQASGLFDEATCRKLQSQFAAQAADGASAGALAEALVAAGKLTRYQAGVLLSGRPGPFVFGDFVITERIEAGRLDRAFRAVYKGAQPALVWFDAAANDSPAQVKATAARFAAARSIKSPHVARVFQFHPAAAPPFFVLEDLRGESLRERLARHPLDLAESCRIGRDAALGLTAFHNAGLVHGNVGAENIWLDRSLSARLLHFPLAWSLVGAARTALPGALYLAPELIDPGRAADARSDLYSLGCVLYELVAGRPPFPGSSAADTLARRRAEAARPLDQAVPSLNPKLAALVAQMLANDPAARTQSAGEIAHLLDALAAEPEVSRPAAAATQPSRAAATGTALPVAHPAPTGFPEAIAPITPAATAAAAENATAPVIFVDTQRGGGPLPSARATAARDPRRTKTPLVAVGAGLLLVGAVIGAAIWARGPKSAANATGTSTTSNTQHGTALPGPATQPSASAESAITDSAGADAAAASAPASAAGPRAGISEIDDDGQTLWASPTAGEPLELRYLPSGTLALVALRPAEILTSDEGRRILDALGPPAATWQDGLEATLGVNLAQVERLLVAFVPDDAGRPQAAYVARLAAAANEPALARAWGNPEPATHKSTAYYRGRGLAFCLPSDGGRRTLVVAPEGLLREVIGRAGEPVLQSALESLLRASDASRHVTLVAAPSYLFTDGRELLAGDLASLRAPLERIFDLSTRAVLASAHFGEELFLELRVLGPSDKRPDQVADALRTQLSTASEAIEQYVASLAPAPYGRLVVHRFPRMVQLAASFTRADAENRQAVLRCYLPASAAHNLVLGAALTLAESPAAAPPAAVAAAPAPGRTAPVATALKRVVSLSFPRDTLEHALELLSADIDAPIVILGPDLQLEGITKNQSFGLDERDQPAEQILRKVLALANSEGKLVYVIKPDEAGRETIYVTTRAAAARRNDALPAGLAEKSPAK